MEYPYVLILFFFLGVKSAKLVLQAKSSFQCPETAAKVPAMSLETASWIMTGLGLYLGIGLLFGLPFVSFGASKIDPAAKDMPLQARLIILPGTMLLWPLMAIKWASQKEPPIS
ncbi:MAG: hypothetical protein AAGK23_05315 [Pseudomonadota bacterium]